MDLGKSTLAKIISCIEKPSKGEVLIDELNTSNKKDFLNIRKKIGIVFQNPENQILFNNVFDDLSFSMKNLGINNYEEKIKNTLEKLDMKEFINAEAYNLSLGQKQRIAIAGVVATNPKYLVFDEPTTMIDPEGKQDIYKMIKDLKEENYTIIYITNIIDEILMSDKIIVIEDGQIINTFLKKDILNQIDFLKEHDIKIPDVIEMIYMLKRKGIDINIENWNKDEIINKLLEVTK